MKKKSSNGKSDVWCDFCNYHVMRDNFCYKSFYRINEADICRDCAKFLPGRCKICGEMKGNCQHRDINE